MEQLGRDMIVHCPSCKISYNVDETKIPEKGIRVNCKKCQTPFNIKRHLRSKDQVEPAISPVLAEENVVQKYIQENNQDAVVRTLYEGIVRYAGLKKFKEAERLREQLIKIAPMALTEIIRADEIIAQEKTAAMDPETVKLWTGLYDQLAQNEAAALYFSLTPFFAKAGTPVFEQGQFDDRLYFIKSGRLKLSYYDNEIGRPLEYAFLEKGDIAGSDPFFNFTTHSSTLTPVNDSELLCLEKSLFNRILAESPSIEGKLFEYCEKRKKMNRPVGKKGQVRRFHKRHRTLLQGQVHKGDPNDKLMKNVMKVTVADISAGGLCYLVENMKKEEAAALHKKWITIIVSYKKGPLMTDLKKQAKVIAVRFHPFGECSIHVKFKELLDEKTLHEISQYAEAAS